MKPKISFSEEQKYWIKRPLLSNIDKILDYRGRTPKKLGLSWSGTGYLALSALNVKNGYIDFNADANYGDQELYDRWMGDNHLHKGQVVFTTEAPMGNVAQIPNDDLYILSQRTIAFEVKHDLIREDFLATLMRSPKIFNELTSLSSGGTAKGVSQKSLSNLKVCVPASLEEQSAIGSLFRTLDDLLASYKDNLANYQSLKATMLSKMFPKAGQTVPEIRLDGFEDEWEIRKLSEISEVYDGTHQTPNYTESGIKFLSVENISTLESEKYISEEDFERDFRVFPEFGDILMTRIGSIGVSNIVTTNEKIAFYVSLALLKPKKRTNSLFVKSSIESNPFQEELWKKTLHIAFPKKINKNEISQSTIKCPSYEEQSAIGTYFSNLDNLITAHQEKISQLETLKKKLLQDMFI